MIICLVAFYCLHLALFVLAILPEQTDDMLCYYSGHTLPVIYFVCVMAHEMTAIFKVPGRH